MLTNYRVKPIGSDLVKYNEDYQLPEYKVAYAELSSCALYIVKEHIDSVGSDRGNSIAEIRCFVVENVIKSKLVFAPAYFVIISNKRDHSHALKIIQTQNTLHFRFKLSNNYFQLGQLTNHAAYRTSGTIHYKYLSGFWLHKLQAEKGRGSVNISDF
jgi:hypothetical protein